MQAQGVWEAIEPRTRNTAIDVKKDKLALAAIYQGIPEDLLLSLAEKQTAKDAWETLKTMFMGADRVKTAKVQTLKGEFETLSMKDTEIIDDLGIKQILANCFYYRTICDLDNMTVEEVIGRLKAHEEMVRGQSESGEGKLLLTHQEWLERSKKKGDEEQRTSQHNTRSSASNNRGRGRGRGRGNYSNRGGLRGGGPIKTEMEDEDLQVITTKARFNVTIAKTLDTMPMIVRIHEKEKNQEANLTQKDDEPALLLAVKHEVNEEAEMVRQAVYIQNRVPTKTLGATTPYESWSRKKPNLEHLRVFGSKAYYLLDPVSDRVRVSRDVRFEEGKQWLWGEATKFKENPKSTFTIEGYNQEDTNLEDETDLTDCNPSQSPMEHKLELTKDEGGVPVNPTLFRSIIRGLSKSYASSEEDLADIPTVIMQEMWRIGGLRVEWYSTLRRIWSPGARKSNNVWHSLHARLSLWLQPPQHVKKYGSVRWFRR
nr:hypothetical protein [Tanacetum cinerariifolium]